MTPAGDVEAISDNFVNRYGFQLGGEICEPAPLDNQMPAPCLTYPEKEPLARMLCDELFRISQNCHLDIELEKMFLHHCVDVHCGEGKLVGRSSICPLASFVQSHCRRGSITSSASATDLRSQENPPHGGTLYQHKNDTFEIPVD